MDCGLFCLEGPPEKERTADLNAYVAAVHQPDNPNPDPDFTTLHTELNVQPGR